MQFFSDEYLEHHGIRGQKWGVRRFQNKDGSLTSAGKKRQKNKHPEFDEFQEKQRKFYAESKQYFQNNKSDVAKQVGTKMADDVFRWRDELAKSDDEDDRAYAKGYYDEEIIRGRSKAKLSSDFAIELNSKIDDALNEKWGRPQVSKVGKNYEINIDGLHEYQDSEPLIVSVDPKSRKVNGLWLL